MLQSRTGGTANHLGSQIAWLAIGIQERLSTEPRDDPEEALKFAIAFEQGVRQKKAICTRGQVTIKEEPVMAVESDKDCYKCDDNFVIGHQRNCKAKNIECQKFGKAGHFTRLCKIKNK